MERLPVIPDAAPQDSGNREFVADSRQSTVSEDLSLAEKREQLRVTPSALWAQAQELSEVRLLPLDRILAQGTHEISSKSPGHDLMMQEDITRRASKALDSRNRIELQTMDDRTPRHQFLRKEGMTASGKEDHEATPKQEKGEDGPGSEERFRSESPRQSDTRRYIVCFLTLSRPIQGLTIVLDSVLIPLLTSLMSGENEMGDEAVADVAETESEDLLQSPREKINDQEEHVISPVSAARNRVQVIARKWQKPKDERLGRHRPANLKLGGREGEIEASHTDDVAEADVEVEQDPQSQTLGESPLEQTRTSLSSSVADGRLVDVLMRTESLVEPLREERPQETSSSSVLGEQHEEEVSSSPRISSLENGQLAASPEKVRATEKRESSASEDSADILRTFDDLVQQSIPMNGEDTRYLPCSLAFAGL